MGGGLHGLYGTSALLYYITGNQKNMLGYLNRFFGTMYQQGVGLDYCQWSVLANSLKGMQNTKLEFQQVLASSSNADDEATFISGLAVQLDGHEEPFCKEFSFDGKDFKHWVVSRDDCIPKDWYNDNEIYYALQNETHTFFGENCFGASREYKGKKVACIAGMREYMKEKKWPKAADAFLIISMQTPHWDY